MPRLPSPPVCPLPAGACDAHTHVFGPYDRFPFVSPSSYEPPLAPFEMHADMLSRIGAARSVVVQPAPYGSDPSAVLDALQRAHGAARGILMATNAVAESTLRTWHEAGVRGLRFSEVVDSGTGKRFAGSVGIEELTTLAPRMKELGWHAQIWASCQDVEPIARSFRASGVPLIFEHMASVAVRPGPAGAAFTKVVELVKDGSIWVKLDLCRISRAMPDYEEVRPFHDALIDANPSRLLWASDWPFVRMDELAPDVGRLVDVFSAWVPDDAIRHSILVENPRELYGFKDGTAT